MAYFDEARDIWYSFVPKSGQADTVQGEMLRAVEKLRYEAMTNGNLNWDLEFPKFIDFLEAKLSDPKVYSADTITRSTEVLLRLRDYENPYLEDDLYDYLADRVVDYFRYFGSQPHEMNPNLRR